MNSNRGLWSDFPMSTGIATLVCYAAVFDDVIEIAEIASRLGVSDCEEFDQAFRTLQAQGRVVARDGFAALSNLSEKIDAKSAKIEKSRRLIQSRARELAQLSRNPLIKFVGISGSLAAKNPTRDRRGQVDIDVFVITRSQTVWLYSLPRIIRSNLFPEPYCENPLCVSFVMDGSNLEVANQNFFTATEVRNLLPISGPAAYREFLDANSWVDKYYPGFSGAGTAPSRKSSNDWINKSLFAIFTLLKSIKRRSFEPLRRMSYQLDPMCGANYNRVNTNYGGYQGMVHRKFASLAARWFPDLLDNSLIEHLFPDQISVAIRRGEIDVFQLNAAAGANAYDYGKY